MSRVVKSVISAARGSRHKAVLVRFRFLPEPDLRKQKPQAMPGASLT